MKHPIAQRLEVPASPESCHHRRRHRTVRVIRSWLPCERCPQWMSPRNSIATIPGGQLSSSSTSTIITIRGDPDPLKQPRPKAIESTTSSIDLKRLELASLIHCRMAEPSKNEVLPYGIFAEPFAKKCGFQKHAMEKTDENSRRVLG